MKKSFSFIGITIFAFDILNLIIDFSMIILFILKITGNLTILIYTPIVAFIVLGLNIITLVATILYLVFRRN